MPVIIAIIVGGVLGSAWGGESGAVGGALLAWLLVRSWRHERQIAALQQSLQKVHAAWERARQPLPNAAAEPVAPEVQIEVARVAPTVEVSPTPSTAAPAFEETLPGPEPTASAAAVPAHTPSDMLAPIKRWLFGGNTIVKAGVGILFIGLAFLAKFASEHVHVSVELRLAGIAAVAIVLLIAGWRLRERRAGYAQVLQGGAVAVLYLTLFVAFRFYGVLAVGPVFALMIVVAALAAALAVLQDARALAMIGALGGFATPLLVSTGSGDHVALFSYYLVLDLGIAAVAWHKNWRLLNLIGFVATFIVATAWGVLKYQERHYTSSQAFLIAFFLLFVAILLLPSRRTIADSVAAQRGDAWVNGCLLFGLPTITFVLQHGLVRHTEYGTAFSALALAAFYALLALWMRSRPRLALTFDASLAIATVFLTLVIPFALDARSTAGAWALEGAGLTWLGLRQRRGLARGFGYVLLLLAGLAMLYAHEQLGVPEQVLNAYLFNALMAAAASLAAALFVQRAAAQGALANPEALAEPLLIGWATLWLLAAAGVQIDNFVAARYQLAAWLAVISGMVLLYTALALYFDWRRVSLPAMAHAPLHALGISAVAVELANPMYNGGAWAWGLAALTHAAVLWRAAPRWSARASNVIHALGVLVLAALGALQGRAITADWGDVASAWPWLGWLVVPAVLLLLMILSRPGTAQHWPLRAAPAAYQMGAGAVLALGLWLWTLLANFASNGSARPLPHVPLLNPLDVGVAVALLAAWLWLRSEVARRFAGDRQAWLVAMLAFAGFVWLNAMLIRAFHHYQGVPYHIDAWAHSLAVQTGIALLWSAIALVLMWTSARRARRELWMVGAALLGAVVLKLLLVDLSGSGTVTRIVSFIGVGVLMLVIGYVAPLPAKGEPHVAT
jgi:uncharacterized membrane protein